MTKEMNQEILRLNGELHAVCVCLSVLCEGMASLHGKPVAEEALLKIEQQQANPAVREEMGDAWSEGFERFNTRLARYIRLPG